MASSPIKVFFDGEELTYVQEVKFSNNVVMLPLEQMSIYLGYEVTWDSQTGVIELRDGSYVITFKVGSKEANVNGKKIELSVAPKSFNGTTYVPLQFISEAMEMGVKWDGKKKQVNIEKKYTFDYDGKKLLCLGENGKKHVVAEGIENYSKDNAYCDACYLHKTKYSSELVELYFSFGGALTTYSSHFFYIKDGKVIDDVDGVSENVYRCPTSGIKVIKDHVVISDDGIFKIYDDTTGEVEKQYELKKWQIQDGFIPVSYSDKYLLGKVGKKGIIGLELYIIDLVNNKVTRVEDLVPHGEEQTEDLMYGVTDMRLVWETDEALVFKYHDESENEDKTVTYMIGK